MRWKRKESVKEKDICEKQKYVHALRISSSFEGKISISWSVGWWILNIVKEQVSVKVLSSQRMFMDAFHAMGLLKSSSGWKTSMSMSIEHGQGCKKKTTGLLKDHHYVHHYVHQKISFSTLFIYFFKYDTIQIIYLPSYCTS